jgi:hypothetical protein
MINDYHIQLTEQLNKAKQQELEHIQAAEEEMKQQSIINKERIEYRISILQQKEQDRKQKAAEVNKININ